MAKTKRTKAKVASKASAEGSEFGKKLQAARLQAGLSQREVAQRVGITVTTVSRYEITTVLPNVAMAAQLAQAVGVSLDQLTGAAKPDTELVVLARKRSALLSGAHREALEGHLNALLELANGVAPSLAKGK